MPKIFTPVNAITGKPDYDIPTNQKSYKSNDGNTIVYMIEPDMFFIIVSMTILDPEGKQISYQEIRSCDSFVEAENIFNHLTKI